MKRMFLAAVLLLSAVVKADIVYNNTLYTVCDSCVTTFDFYQHANANNAVGGPSAMIIVNTTNQKMFRDIRPGIVRKLENTAGPFSPPNFQFVSLSTTEQNWYDSYINYLITFKDYFAMSEPREVGIVEVDQALTSNLIWLGNTDFTSEYQSTFNLVAGRTLYNPYFFLNKPLTIEVVTNDGYTVELYRHFDSSKKSWHILKARNVKKDLVDVNGNILDPLTSHQSPEFCSAMTCEQTCRTIKPDSGEPITVLPFFKREKEGVCIGDPGGKLPGCDSIDCTIPTCNLDNCPPPVPPPCTGDKCLLFNINAK